jgi:hypothetical protein
MPCSPFDYPSSHVSPTFFCCLNQKDVSYYRLLSFLRGPEYLRRTSLSNRQSSIFFRHGRPRSALLHSLAGGRNNGKPIRQPGPTLSVPMASDEALWTPRHFHDGDPTDMIPKKSTWRRNAMKAPSAFKDSCPLRDTMRAQH